MRAIAPWLLILAVLPRVEDPWPDTIGVGLPFTTATAGAILASVAYVNATQERRDRAIGQGGFWGFFAGILLYVVSWIVQISSEL